LSIKKTVIVTFFLMAWACYAEILIMPFPIAGVDSTAKQTINELFMEYFQENMKEKFTVSPDATCKAKTCAVETAEAMGASEVIYGSSRKLGEKWIVSGFRFRLSDKKFLASQRLNSRSLEDFDFVMKRLAKALIEKKSVEEVVTIDNVTETEMDPASHRRRKGFYAYGIKFGYAFPVGAKSYIRETQTDYGYEIDSLGNYNYTVKPGKILQFKQILKTDFVNWYELHRDFVLEWDLHVGWGAEMGTHFTLLKLLSRSDFAPFLGGGVGIDYVFADRYTDDTDNRNSGIALNARAGLLAFRTYDIRMLLSTHYKLVFDTDFDQSINVDMGVLFKKQPPEYRRGGGNVLTTTLAVIGGIVVFGWVIALLAF